MGQSFFRSPFLDELNVHLHEVLPFVPDAFVDLTVVDTQDKARGIVGYEVNFNKYFYKYVPPRDPEEIAKEIQTLEAETNLLMKELFQ